MALVAFKHSSRGYQAILRSDAVREDLLRRAQAVKAVADERTVLNLIADSYTGTGRAGATVIGVLMSEELANGIMANAIDAARR